MAVNLTNIQKEVIRKIIYAVETGGQVYGKVRYNDFTEAYTNSSAEHAITIGGGAWYATEAKRLLNLIRKTYPSKFNVLDTQGIANDLDSQNWSTYKLSKNSAKAKCIVSIIASSEGIKCQDALMDSQITDYMTYIQNTYGDMSVDAIAECINIKHQGGNGALKRILDKTEKPYSAKTIYASLCTDPNDKSNNNQVGDYTSRQKKVYEMINTYLLPTMVSGTVTNSLISQGGNIMTEMELRTKVVSIAKEYYGCKESNGSHRKIIDGYNAVRPLARGYKVTYTDAWCATFVSFVSIKAGLTDIMFRECGCGAMIQLYQNAGRWVENDAYVPKIGDIVMYDWDDSGKGDCTGYPEHVGIVISVNGNTIRVIEGNMNNAVGYRNLAVNGRYIRGYCIPNYASKATTSSSTTTSKPSTTTKPSTATSSNTALNKTVKWNGYVTADELNVRVWAGKANKTCSFSPLKENTEVGVCDSVKASDGVIWYYIKYKGKYGFVSSKYIQKKITNTPSVINQKVEYAQSYLKAIAGIYRITTNLDLRVGAGKDKGSQLVIPKGDSVTCYGYYTSVSGVKWYFVSYKTYTGFVSSEYLKK